MARRRRLPRDPVEAEVSDLNHEGRGVAHVEGKAVFVAGALAGERVRMRYTRRHRRWDEARLEEVLRPAPERIAPGCPHFGVCGGCSLQHLSPQDQLRFKSGVLAEQFRHIGGVEPERWLAPLEGPVWGYRGKARLAAKYVARKGDRVLVGFREQASPYVADLTRCPVLHPAVGERLEALAALVRSLDIHDRLPQIEVAAGDDTVALVFRNLEPLGGADRERLAAFGREHGFAVFQQPGNESTVAPVWPEAPELSYALPAHDISLAFRPTDFTQVNARINRAMVDRALELLAPGPADRVLDLFCGLGNFTLPLARRAGEVLGLEGDAGLVERAAGNARRNGIDNARFQVADLADPEAGAAWAGEDISLALLDPPRSGAAAVLAPLAAARPRRIVYVSCGPATLARDAGTLVREHGYRLAAAGVMDMFPHTAHVESIALFLGPGEAA